MRWGNIQHTRINSGEIVYLWFGCAAVGILAGDGHRGNFNRTCDNIHVLCFVHMPMPSSDEPLCVVVNLVKPFDATLLGVEIIDKSYVTTIITRHISSDNFRLIAHIFVLGKIRKNTPDRGGCADVADIQDR